MIVLSLFQALKWEKERRSDFYTRISFTPTKRFLSYFLPFSFCSSLIFLSFSLSSSLFFLALYNNGKIGARPTYNSHSTPIRDCRSLSSTGFFLCLVWHTLTTNQREKRYLFISLLTMIIIIFSLSKLSVSFSPFPAQFPLSFFSVS